MEDIIKYYQINYNKNIVNNELFNELSNDLKVYIGSFLNEYELLKKERKYKLEKYILQLETNKYKEMMLKIQNITNNDVFNWCALENIEIYFHDKKKRTIKRNNYYINANTQTNAYIELRKNRHSNDTCYAYDEIKYFKYSHKEHNFIFNPKIYIKCLRKVLYDNNFDSRIIEFYEKELNNYGLKLDKKNEYFCGRNNLTTELIKLWKK